VEIAQFGIFVVLVILGAIIFDLASVMCGFDLFVRKNLIKPIFISLFAGSIALLLSDMPNALLGICCKYGSITDPKVLTECIEYLQEWRHYTRLAVISISLAFLISGFIGSDFPLNFWKVKSISEKEHVRNPLNCWDAFLWLYGKTENEIRIYIKGTSESVRGKLDFRSIGDEPEEIIIKDPKDSNNNPLGYSMLIRGQEIQKLVLENPPEQYNRKDALKDIFGKNLLHVITFFLGLIFLVIYILNPHWLFISPYIYLKPIIIGGIIFFHIIL